MMSLFCFIAIGVSIVAAEGSCTPTLSCHACRPTQSRNAPLFLLGTTRASSIVHTFACRFAPICQPFWLAEITIHIKIFKGECADGKEIRMYKGNGDNPGTAEERALRCSEACRNKKTPLSGTWTNFVANGFVVQPTDGSCYCENSESLTCKRGSTSSAYYRYDWKSRL